MNSPCKPYQEADQKLEKDNSGVYSLKTLSVEEVQTKEKECSMKRDQGMDGKVDSEDNSPVTLFDEECQSLQESVNHGMDFPQKISETEDQEKERKVDSGIHSPMGVNEEVQEMKDYDNKETISLQKISEKENEEIKGTVDSGVGDGTPETKDNDSEETDSVQEISEVENPELEGDDDSRFFTPKTPSWEACGDTKERNSPQRLDEKKDKDKESDDDISEDEVFSLTHLFKEDVQEYEAVDNREMKYPKKIQIPKMDDKRLMIGEERKGNLEKGDDHEVYLITQSSKEESRKKTEGIGSGFWNSPGIDRKTNQTKRDPVRKNIFHLNKTTASTLDTVPSSFYVELKELVLPSSEETQKQIKKLACGSCNKYCLYWNVCPFCDIFLCDFCFSISHPPILQHKITRYIAFSEFGCLAHIRISKYFCLDCIRPRCEDCKKERCRGHYLITRDFKDNIDHGKVKEGNILERKRTEKQALTTQPFKSASSGTKPCCKYCHLSQEQYNLCKDCMEFFCDFCLALYHPKGHTICKDVSFSQFACAKHKIVYRYFCDQCKMMRCDECLVLEMLCSEHASSLHKLEDHMTFEQKDADGCKENGCSNIMNNIETKLDIGASGDDSTLCGKETVRPKYNSDEKENESDGYGNRIRNFELVPYQRWRRNLSGDIDLIRSEISGSRIGTRIEKVELNRSEDRTNGNMKSDECNRANEIQSTQLKNTTKKIRQTLQQTAEEKCSVDHFCKFCGLKSELYNICEDCMIYFCETCCTRYHPSHHRICRSKPFSFFGCSEHMNICIYFCDNCNAMRCDDCILMNGKCSDHKITRLLKYVLKEKEGFDSEMQNFFNNSSQTINILSEQLDAAENSTLMTKLQNEETLRQEFASLRFLITEKEQQMWSDLKQEYKLQIRRIRQQRREIGLYVKEDSKLFSKSVTSLGTSSLLNFHSDAQEIRERLNRLKRRLEGLQSPEDIVEPPLASKFSLCRTKQELLKSLRLPKPDELEISCLDHTVYFEDPTKPLRVKDLVTMPDSTLSSFYMMRVEIRKTVKEVIWQSDCCNVDDYIANVEGRIAFESKSRYVIKIYLDMTIFESTTNFSRRTTKPKHILLVTGQSMDTTDELSHHSSNIIGLHIEDEEKKHVQFRERRYFGQTWKALRTVEKMTSRPVRKPVEHPGQPLVSSTPIPGATGSGPQGVLPGATASPTAPTSVAQVRPEEGEVLCVDVVAFQEYTRLQQKLKDTETAIQVLSSTSQLKKLKFDLQKVVNIPVNAISAVSGAHLRDKLQRLLVLLSGQQVEITNKRVSVNEHPVALTFCKHLIAKMVVKKGEEQVSSIFESVFPLAAVTVGILAEHPDIKDLLLAHFQLMCPYIVPYHIPRQEGQSTKDVHIARGYKYDSDGNVEKQDKFLKRMSGIMRLYASLMVSYPPRRQSEHPFGIENAWLWLSRVMNIQPLPDITATMVFDLLEVTGHALYKEYRKQFLKMLHILIREFLPKLKSVASSGGGGPVSRLEALIMASIQRQGQIPPPEGILSPNFCGHVHEAILRLRYVSDIT